MWGCWLLLDSLWDYLPQWVLFCEFLIFVIRCHILLIHRLILCILVFPCWGLTLCCKFLHLYPKLVTGDQVHCTSRFCILVDLFLLGCCTPIFPSSLTVDVVFLWFHCKHIFSGACTYVILFAFVGFDCCCCLHWKRFRCIGECGYMVNVLDSWADIILVCAGDIHFVYSVGNFSSYDITYVCASVVDFMIAHVLIVYVCFFAGCTNFLFGSIFTG